jgi:hypothetical protein
LIDQEDSVGTSLLADPRLVGEPDFYLAAGSKALLRRSIPPASNPSAPARRTMISEPNYVHTLFTSRDVNPEY